MPRRQACTDRVLDWKVVFLFIVSQVNDPLENPESFGIIKSATRSHENPGKGPRGVPA